MSTFKVLSSTGRLLESFKLTVSDNGRYVKLQRVACPRIVVNIKSGTLSFPSITSSLHNRRSSKPFLIVPAANMDSSPPPYSTKGVDLITSNDYIDLEARLSASMTLPTPAHPKPIMNTICTCCLVHHSLNTPAQASVLPSPVTHVIETIRATRMT